MQRIGHHAPPALISSPEDALQAVRTAMVLDAVLPEMRQQVEALANDLSELFKVRKQIAAERDRLKKQVASLGSERTRMQALIGERQKQQAEREKALDAERARAKALAEKAGNLKDLIAELEKSLPADDTRGARGGDSQSRAVRRWPPCTIPGGWRRRSPSPHCAGKFRFRLMASN